RFSQSQSLPACADHAAAGKLAIQAQFGDQWQHPGLISQLKQLTMTFAFRLLATDGAARAGEMTTPHGSVATPAFMPVGTQATVKGLPPDAVRAIGADVVLANTYHLTLRPGAERIAALGGLHTFMRWPRAIL